MWYKTLIAGLIGYFLGNISVGILVGRLFGVDDIRTKGSGNAGSTNVLRTLGWVPSLLTLAGDCLKSFIAAKIGYALAGDIGLLVGGTACILGHNYPLLFRFRGGKGVASTLGVMIAIDPRIALIMFVIAIGIIALTRYVSVASLTAAVLYPFLTALMLRANPHRTLYVLFAVFASLLVIFCHRANIGRLIRHEENRLDFQKISKLRAKLRMKK